MSKKTIQNRINALKTRKDRRYYVMSLRDDLAQLISSGLDKKGITQRALAELADYEEAYVSRLANAMSDFKIEAIARILIPLDITPMLVDKAEFDRLQELERIGTASRNSIAETSGSSNRVISQAKAGEVRVHGPRNAGGDYTADAAATASVHGHWPNRSTDDVCGTCPVLVNPREQNWTRGIWTSRPLHTGR